jgi:hypothetical protein
MYVFFSTRSTCSFSCSSSDEDKLENDYEDEFLDEGKRKYCMHVNEKKYKTKNPGKIDCFLSKCAEIVRK